MTCKMQEEPLHIAEPKFSVIDLLTVGLQGKQNSKIFVEKSKCRDDEILTKGKVLVMM